MICTEFWKDATSEIAKKFFWKINNYEVRVCFRLGEISYKCSLTYEVLKSIQMQKKVH